MATLTRKIELEIVSPENRPILDKKYGIRTMPATCLIDYAMAKTKKDVETTFRGLFDKILPQAYNRLPWLLLKNHDIIDPKTKKGDFSRNAQTKKIDGDKSIRDMMNDFLEKCRIEYNANIKKGKINNIPSDIVSMIISDVCDNNMCPHFSEIKKYERSIPFYTKKNVHMGMLNSKRNLDFFKIEDENEYYMYWRGIYFKTNLRKDRQGNRKLIENLINNVDGYKKGDSKLEYNKKKFILLFSVTVPDSKNKFDSSLIMGLDLGLRQPVTAAIIDKVNPKEPIIDDYSKKPLVKVFDGGNLNVKYNKDSYETVSHQPYLIQLRNSYKKRESLAREKSMYSGISGHGRKKMMETYYNICGKESRASKNYFHNLSAQVIRYAMQNNVGIIHMEDLSGIGKTDSILSENWGYYALQQMIEYKAKKNGIDVKYVDPKNTSRTCSYCNYLYDDKEMGIKWSTNIHEWVCPHCGTKHDRDINAAVNIAASINFVEENKKHKN